MKNFKDWTATKEREIHFDAFVKNWENISDIYFQHTVDFDAEVVASLRLMHINCLSKCKLSLIFFL